MHNISACECKQLHYSETNYCCGKSEVVSGSVTRPAVNSLLGWSLSVHCYLYPTDALTAGMVTDPIPGLVRMTPVGFDLISTDDTVLTSLSDQSADKLQAQQFTCARQINYMCTAVLAACNQTGRLRQSPQSL